MPTIEELIKDAKFVGIDGCIYCGQSFGELYVTTEMSKTGTVSIKFHQECQEKTLSLNKENI